MTRIHRSTALLLTAAMTTTLACMTSTTQAVQPGQWTHTTEADFSGGDPVETIITNLGDIRLSSKTTEIAEMPEGVTVIHDVVTVKGETYVAAGPKATLLKIVDGKAKVVAELEGEQIFTLAEYEGELLIGISGENARIARIGQDELETIAELPGTQYVWDLLPVGKEPGKPDRLLIATGLEGKVLSLLEGTEEAKVLLETQQANVLCLAADAKGQIYAGTDQDGLIYRIDQDGTAFVVYDAAEAEIATLLVTADGTVYAGTAAADQAKPGRMNQPVDKETGRVDPEHQPEPQPAPDEPAAEEPAEEPAAEQPKPQEQKPTAEQYDRLRDTMRQRLEQARNTGELNADVDGAPPRPAANNNPPARPSRARPAAPAQKKQGNAIYQIDPQGFVKEVFRESVMILSIAPLPDQPGKLLVTTGNEGQVYSVDPARAETTVLTDLDSQQVTCAATTEDGLLLGAASPAKLVLMDQGVAPRGTYTSQVLDAGQVSMFGTFKLTADIPEGCSVTVETRSGNVGDPETAAWSKWTEADILRHNAEANALQPREVKVAAPPARYLQYRLTLISGQGKTPVVDQTDLAYVSPNVPPQIAALNVTVPAVGEPGAAHDPNINLQWQASDDNSDRLVYTLEYKPAGAQRYLPLAKDLTDARYQWKTQHVPDGWYTVRVSASDTLDNPADMARSGSRTSEPLLVDNTAPTLDGLEAKVADGKVTLTATAGDALSPIKSVAYSIDGSEQYRASLPKDLIYDSTSEPWAATISDLSPGEHVIAVRVIDARGNTAYRQVIVTVK